MPENGGYMTAAYVVTAAIYVGYWLRLRAKAKRELAGRREGGKAGG